MRSIFAFFGRYYRYFLFILLETVSIVLVINNNKFQNAAFFNFTTEISGNTHTLYSNVNTYFHLKDLNDSLVAENSRLRAQLKTSKYIDSAKPKPVNDTIFKQKYSYIPAAVVNNSVTERSNYLTVAVGQAKGVTHDMGVITTSGVVGITQNVSSHYASVMSILHADFQINAEILELKEISGSVIWDKDDLPGEATLINVPVHVHIAIGQHIVTGPYSALFPQGIAIGTVKGYKIVAGKPFYNIKIALATDMRNVRQVYIINNIQKPEQQSVETKKPE